jgi:hypothetical protein
MKTLPVILATCLLAACYPGIARGQAAPAATSTPTVPTLNTAPLAGVLNYSLSASQSILLGYNGYSGLTSSTNVTGSAEYVSNSQKNPFSFLYSGGYLFGDGTGQPGYTFQDFGVSQVYNTRNFTFLAGDQVSYLPNSPIFALSGVPGVGDIGTQPIGTGSIPTASILTNYGRRVTNTVNGSVTDRLTGSTSLSAFGDYTILRFQNSAAGLDDNEVDAGANLNHRISGNNTFGVGYTYSNFSYLPGQSDPYLSIDGGNLSITTQEVNLQYQHVFSRQLMLAASIGPERTSSSDSALMPASTNLAADLSLFYKAESTTYLLSYSRGTSAGSGVLLGVSANNVNFTANHTFSREWSGSFSANYSYASQLQTVGLPNTTTSSLYTGVQATRTLGRYFSTYASYNVETQSFNQPFYELNAFDGTEQVIGLGITYSPRPIHLGHP